MIIGVLGGGQLGQMLIQSAIGFNVKVAVLDPDHDCPCSSKSDFFVRGDLNSKEDIIAFAKKVDILTIEIENVNVEALELVAKAGKKVIPQPRVLKVIKDKVSQKQFYRDNDIPTAAFRTVKNRREAELLLRESYGIAKEKGLPMPRFINKIGIGGYDGRGVQVIKGESDFGALFDTPGILEEFISFEKEISVIIARNLDGEVKCYPPVELHFNPNANLVEHLLAPADIGNDVSKNAIEIAEKMIKTLDMVGVLAVEMFLTADNSLIVNEVSPRTHNSGHHTIEGNVTSQFEQHLRVLLDHPLGDTSTLFPVVMVNVLGAEPFVGEAYYLKLRELFAMDGVHIHLYGKKNTKPNRKMGHITVVEKDCNLRWQKVEWIKRNFKVISS